MGNLCQDSEHAQNSSQKFLLVGNSLNKQFDSRLFCTEVEVLSFLLARGGALWNGS